MALPNFHISAFDLIFTCMFDFEQLPAKEQNVIAAATRIIFLFHFILYIAHLAFLLLILTALTTSKITCNH